ncbi:hypothetical protein IAT38_004166 [Cryptococcus sp. DSM 104549]
MIMTSSPILTPHTRSIAHTPSPSSSPKLVPVPSTIVPSTSLPLSAHGSTPAPAAHPTTGTASTTSAPAPSASGLSASMPTRSFARQPQARPYQSPLLARQMAGKARQMDPDTKRFAELVVGMMGDRLARAGAGAGHNEKGLVEMIENVKLEGAVDVKQTRPAVPRKASLAGSWEAEKAELIVDIPVWSPGCFQDLSTLHTLRDKTLSHTHALLAHLLNTHSTPATYRLLARSAVAPGPTSSPFHHGWGCIRLAPSSISGDEGKPRELKAKVRRASLVRAHSHQPHVPRPEDLSHESVLLDSDEEDAHDRAAAGEPVRLRQGFWSGSGGSVSGSEDEDEEECADVVVGREVEKRGGKEGTVFLMTLFGQPALILT